MKIAVVGASSNSEKYGNKIIKDLICKSHVIFPVNPIEENIEGLKCYQNVSQIEEGFDIAVFVVPPEVTMNVIQKYYDTLKNTQLWFQPGSTDAQIKQFLSENNLKNYTIDACIMLENL